MPVSVALIPALVPNPKAISWVTVDTGFSSISLAPPIKTEGPVLVTSKSVRAIPPFGGCICSKNCSPFSPVLITGFVAFFANGLNMGSNLLAAGNGESA